MGRVGSCKRKVLTKYNPILSHYQEHATREPSRNPYRKVLNLDVGESTSHIARSTCLADLEAWRAGVLARGGLFLVRGTENPSQQTLHVLLEGFQNIVPRRLSF